MGLSKADEAAVEGRQPVTIDADIARQRFAKEDADPKSSALLVDMQAEQVARGGRMPWPDPVAREAHYGIVGRIVNTLEPHTEADSAAILGQSLVFLGHQVGPGPFVPVEANRHGTNMNGVVVGDTSKGRKGTSLAQVDRVCRGTSIEVKKISGLGSGEALISEVADIDQDSQFPAEAAERKRLLIVEPEWGGPLSICGRDGSILSSVIRQAWDRDPLLNLTKSQRLKSTGHHISLVGHITSTEMREKLGSTEIANGMANRHLFFLAKRSKYLPEGGSLTKEAEESLSAAVNRTLLDARALGQVPVLRNELSRDLWAHIYPGLSDGFPGLAGAVLARGEAYVTRLSLIYCVLDNATMVRPEHLLAALAVWDYCCASVFYIFGNRLGHTVADAILDELRERPEGLTKTEMSALFQRNKTASEIGRALRLLEEQKLIRSVKERENPSQKRPTERFVASKENNFVNFVRPGFLKTAKAYLASRSWRPPNPPTKNEFNEVNKTQADTEGAYDHTIHEFNEVNPGAATALAEIPDMF